MSEPAAATDLDPPRQVTFRPIRPDDVARLQAFHQRLSLEAIRLRFHSYLRELPDAMARHFCEVDGQNRVALVAVAGEPEQIVAVGRFDREQDDTAEVAFVVADAYQRQGIRAYLFRRLIAEARQGGIRTLIARVLPGNTAMRRLLEHTGYPLQVEYSRDANCIRLSLVD